MAKPQAVLMFETELIELLEKWGYKVKQPIERLTIDIEKGQFPVVRMGSTIKHDHLGTTSACIKRV